MTGQIYRHQQQLQNNNNTNRKITGKCTNDMCKFPLLLTSLWSCKCTYLFKTKHEEIARHCMHVCEFFFRYFRSCAENVNQNHWNELTKPNFPNLPSDSSCWYRTINAILFFSVRLNPLTRIQHGFRPHFHMTFISLYPNQFSNNKKQPSTPPNFNLFGFWIKQSSNISSNVDKRKVNRKKTNRRRFLANSVQNQKMIRRYFYPW